MLLSHCLRFLADNLWLQCLLLTFCHVASGELPFFDAVCILHFSFILFRMSTLHCQISNAHMVCDTCCISPKLHFAIYSISTHVELLCSSGIALCTVCMNFICGFGKIAFCNLFCWSTHYQVYQLWYRLLPIVWECVLMCVLEYLTVNSTMMFCGYAYMLVACHMLPITQCLSDVLAFIDFTVESRIVIYSINCVWNVSDLLVFAYNNLLLMLSIVSTTIIW